jgi:hypothetical protein
MISRTSLETAKEALALWVAEALWAVLALWVAQVAQVAQARCLGAGRRVGQQDPGLGVRQGRLLLHEEPLRLLHGLQPGELLKGHRPDVDNEERPRGVAYDNAEWES